MRLNVDKHIYAFFQRDIPDISNNGYLTISKATNLYSERYRRGITDHWPGQNLKKIRNKKKIFCLVFQKCPKFDFFGLLVRNIVPPSCLLAWVGTKRVIKAVVVLFRSFPACISFLVAFTPAVPLLAESMLALTIVTVAVLSLHPPVAVFLPCVDEQSV